MKIGISGLDVEAGKKKVQDLNFLALVEKFKPKKVSPFYVEILIEEFVHCDLIAIHQKKLLDLLIMDMEKMEARLDRSDNQDEKRLAKMCLDILEKEKPLCDSLFNHEEQSLLNALSPLSLKPTLVLSENLPDDQLVNQCLSKGKTIFFYTAGDKEVHAWSMPEGSTILACAAKIHSDLARGFIKGEVVSTEKLLTTHNWNDAKSQGLVKLVDKDHIILDSDVIEIRFNV